MTFEWTSLRTGLGGAGTVLIGLLVGGCGVRSPVDARLTNAPPAVEGRLIGERVVASNAGRTGPAPAPGPEVFDDGFLRLGFETLSAFNYRVYEYHAEGVSGRPLLKSDDTIPEAVRKLDGRKVVIRGFVLPLRTRKGKVTEFLLLRDQGTCCFGPQAQINHFIRVNLPKGGEFTQGLPCRAGGTLRVGEVYVQGYLTGIYQLDAEWVDTGSQGGP